MNLLLFVVHSPLLLLLSKWTALFALGWMVHFLISGRHPRSRMILWRTVLCFSLVLPLMPISPFRFPRIPVRESASASPPPVEALQANLATPVVSPAPTRAETPDQMSAKPTEHIKTKLVQPRPAGHPLPWKSALLSIWAVGCAVGSLRLGRLQRRLDRLRKNAVLADPVLQRLVRTIRSTYDIGRSVELRLSAQTGSPFICGLVRPTILLPAAMAKELSLTDLTVLLSHEIAHLRHQDLLWCLGWQISKIAFWFHPLVWCIPGVHNFACEEEADRIASRQTEDRNMYAQSLARLTLSVLSLPDVETKLSLNGASQIARRLERLQQGGIGHWNWKYSLGGCVLSTMLCLIAVAPAFSQADERTAIDANRATRQPASHTTNSGTSQNYSTSALSTGIHARVVDAAGNSVPNADVQCLGFDWRATTDADGRFSWNGEAQPRAFQIKKSGYQTLFTGLLGPSEKTTVLAMQPAVAIAGKVIDKVTRQPISKFQVYHVRSLQGPVTPSLSPPEDVTGDAGVFEYSFTDDFWPDSALYVDADGYSPILSRPLTRADNGSELNFELSRSLPVKGVVLSPQGTPAEKAKIRLWCGQFNISDIPSRHKTESDKHGAFTVPAILDGKILVYHRSGYAETPWQEFVANGTIQLSQWGRVKVHWPKPLPAERRISLEPINWAGQMNTFTFPAPWTVANMEVYTRDVEFGEQAPPGEYMLTEWKRLRINHPGGGVSVALLMSRRMQLVVGPGRTTIVEVPVGRTVLGKLAVNETQTLTNGHLPIVSLRLKQNTPRIDFPRPDASLTDTQNFDRLKQYRQRVLDFWLSEQGKALRRAERVYETHAEPDGSFRLDNVPAGVYELQINVQRWSANAGAELRREVTISASTDETPVDLGLLR